MATDKKISELPVASAINAADLSVLVNSGTDYQFAFSTLLQFISSGLAVGANITFGTTLPQNTSGKDGDVFINTLAGSFAQKVSGIWTVTYTLPSSGGSTDGTVLYGLGIPGSATGNNNDTYINTGTGIFYKKSAGSWSQVFSMQTGPAGPAGANGTNGTNGLNGKTILNGTTNPSNLSIGTDGDFYINTSTFMFFGPKASGVWPAGTSLAGADGATGATGAKGDKGDTGNIGPAGADGKTSFITPDKLTGIEGWYDITDLSSIVFDTSLKVSLISDKSSNGNDLVQATSANQPTITLLDSDNGLPSINISGGTFIGNALSLALPYTIYLYCKQNSYASGSLYVNLGGSLNGIVQQFDNLTIVSNNAWIGLDASNNRKYCLFRFSLKTGGDAVISIDSEPVMGNDSRFPTGDAGISPITNLQIGGAGSPDFEVQEMILMNDVISDEDHIALSNYFNKKYKTVLNKPLRAFGDSITRGTGATDAAHSYASLLASALNADLYNYGITGTTVGYGVAHTGNNFCDLYKSVNAGAQNGFTLYCYGTNDGSIADVNWKQLYKSMINQDIVLHQLDKSKTIIVTPPYNSSYTWLPQMIIWISEIASELGIRFADWSGAMQAAGLDTTLTDGLHPDNAGHALGAATIAAALA